MKAVIMAGGEGTRLRPLTCDLPKPMARLCGRPVIEHIIDLLSRNGISEAAVTLRYLPEIVIDAFQEKEFHGVKLEFVEEEKPLGTAGGVLNAVKNSNVGSEDDIIVISGDAMCDFDLKSAVEFHQKNGADATLVLSRVADPREYGLVVTDDKGLVKGFVEKPGWSQAVTDAINTGIYIISKSVFPLIPEDTPFDFAKDLFPLMLSKNMKVCGYEAQGYWCDIGDIGAYTSCQFEMLDEYVDYEFDGIINNGVYFKKLLPKGNYKIIPPAFIGEGVKIGDYSVIGPFAVVDDNAVIGSFATIKDSVLLQDTFVGDHCELRGALVCAGASIKHRAQMYEGSVAGAKSVIGADSHINPGVRIWPGKHVEDGAHVSSNIKTGCAHHTIFDDEGISGEIGVEITPENCARIGAASAGIFNDGKIGVCCDKSAAAKNLKTAVLTGITSAGAEACDFGNGFEAMFNFAVGFCDLDMGIFVKVKGNRAILKLIEKGGLGIGRSGERKIESSVATGEIRRCNAEKYHEPVSFSGIETFYRRSLLKSAPKGYQSPFIIRSGNSEIRTFAAKLFKSCGIEITSDIHSKAVRLHIDDDGKRSSIFCEDGTYLNPSKMLLLGCIAAFENDEDVSLPFGAPNAINAVAEKYRKKVFNYFDCPTDKADTEARTLAKHQTWVRDGIENALRVVELAKSSSMTLKELNDSIPDFAVSVRAVTCSVNPGKILRKLAAGIPLKMTEGVSLEKANGRVYVSPMKRGTGIRIIAEAVDMETAGELCADMERELTEDSKTIDNAVKTI